MNILRDPQGRFINTKKSIKIIINSSRGCNTPTTNSPKRYKKTPKGSNSAWKPKEPLPIDLTKGTIEGEGTLARGHEYLISE